MSSSIAVGTRIASCVGVWRGGDGAAASVGAPGAVSGTITCGSVFI
jgi:hypothetical protein